jgi:hypothetical protein
LDLAERTFDDKEMRIACAILLGFEHQEISQAYSVDAAVVSRVRKTLKHLVGTLRDDVI